MTPNPGTSAILSFFWTGLGQIYNGELGKGLLFMINPDTIMLDQVTPGRMDPREATVPVGARAFNRRAAAPPIFRGC